ncbi:T9SS type A sorting domain-containing protein [Flavobacteriaceae bacterium]|jgi:hypothetical protein|nr:T9SS type A sorting domain-containing protein [Flavobacteriaceae bacterium]MDA7724133.1 T9SS type A sorting domain-containing protein [Flavobacteriaceae bacterium]MDA7849047.1 T9SS type A sorting domain-containing protein [Flavobacteriaceae bacterium]MDG1310117.1 T9SS type A sorting domain-containing protein [Flavobacteriaceae bacterium]
MKKITLILSLLISAYGFAQNVSTGVVQLASDFTVQFDVNGTTNKVTMTMIGPANVWLAVALNKSHTPGSGMGTGGEDVIIYHSTTGVLSDRYLTGNVAPTTDGTTNQDWSISTNDITGTSSNTGVRTIVATRDLDTNDSNDYVFTTTNTDLPLLWAKGSSLTLGYHGARGSAAASTLGNEAIAALPEFNVYPNPTLRELNLEFPASVQKAQVAVYSVLGSLVFQAELDQFNSKINTSEWNSGVYIMNISTSDFSETKRIIKK